MARNTFPPVHPGVTLEEDFLKPLNLSGTRLAIDLHVPPSRINDILHARRGITAETALRIARYFGTSAAFWMNLQMQYDLAIAEDASSNVIEREVHPRGTHESSPKRARARKRPAIVSAAR
jgi:addiction module HigA family antidote